MEAGTSRAWPARLAVAALVVAAAAPAARADDAAYLGVGTLHWKYTEAGGPTRADATGISVRAGTHLNDYLGFGAEIGSGGTATLRTGLGGDSKRRLQYLASLYAVGTAPLARVDLYARVGIATAQFKPSAGLAGYDTFNGYTAGAGAEVRLTGGLFAGGEVVRYIHGGVVDVTTSSIFARYRFE